MKNNYGFDIYTTYKNVSKSLYTAHNPLQFNDAAFKVFNDDLANALSLNTKRLNTPHGCQFMLANTDTPIFSPIALAYAGHQYGHFNILGDGRAHLLFEHKHENTLYDIQLKGSGPTVYSRGFDGRATLRSALLEYLMSEAMFALNIPTTRSLAVIETNDKIERIGPQDAGVLVRIAKSHLRVGTFELIHYKDDIGTLKKLANYAIFRHDKDLMNKENIYLAWYERIIARQAKLVALWQSVGFVHGVMNTDNTTISGETIDYGPCAFIDQYDLKAVYSSIDSKGRYAYGNQPYIASWNLAKLGLAILPLIDKDKSRAINLVQSALERFGHLFEGYYYQIMANKLGYEVKNNTDIALIDKLLALLEKYASDYTVTFRALTDQNYLNNALFNSQAFLDWEMTWKKRIKDEKKPFDQMKKSNPVVIPRNHLVKHALDQACNEKNFETFDTLLKIVQNPFDKNIPQAFKEVPTTHKPYVTYCGT